MGKIIDEIREITALVVSKKQNAAVLNYPKIISQIRSAAESGLSECKIDSAKMNEYDRSLLQTDGFTVRLVDKESKDRYQQFDAPKKEWVIRW